METPLSSMPGQRRVRWADVSLPSQEVSARLVDYDERWNSWMHYAVEYPGFHDEHLQFWTSFEAGVGLEDFDPAWLAVYFSIITVRGHPPYHTVRLAHVIHAAGSAADDGRQ